MELQHALSLATRLRDALAAEVESAREERRLLRDLDTGGLFARSAERTHFLAETGRLQRDLALSLGRAAGTLGLSEVTLQRLRERASDGGAVVADVLSEVRALAAALQEIDRLNLQLARRALACVRGYVEALQPRGRAYDRRGGRTSAPALALVSAKG